MDITAGVIGATSTLFQPRGQILPQHRTGRTKNFPIDTSQLINTSKTSDINGANIMRLSWWKISETEIRETM